MYDSTDYGYDLLSDSSQYRSESNRLDISQLSSEYSIHSSCQLPSRTSTLMESFLTPNKPPTPSLLTNIDVWIYVIAATTEVTVIKAVETWTTWPDLPYLTTFFLNLYFPFQWYLWQRQKNSLQLEGQDNGMYNICSHFLSHF